MLRHCRKIIDFVLDRTYATPCNESIYYYSITRLVTISLDKSGGFVDTTNIALRKPPNYHAISRGETDYPGECEIYVQHSNARMVGNQKLKKCQ